MSQAQTRTSGQEGLALTPPPPPVSPISAVVTGKRCRPFPLDDDVLFYNGSGFAHIDDILKWDYSNNFLIVLCFKVLTTYI